MIRNFNKSTTVVLLLWLLIVPASMVYLFQIYFPQEVNWLYFCVFAILAILTVSFPITRNGKPLFLVMWVTVPVFVMYGIVLEIIIMQLVIFVTLFRVPNQLPKVFRFFTNSLYFFILSFISAIAFHLVGGEVGSFDFWPLVLAVYVYQFTHSFWNELILQFYAFYMKVKSPYLARDILLNYSILLVVLPFALMLYYLLAYIGGGAFFLLGIPFFFITFLIRLYRSSEKINRNLRQAGDIGHMISDKLLEKDVIDQFVMHVSTMFRAEYAYLFDYKEEWLEPIRSYEHGRFLDIAKDFPAPGQRIAEVTLLKNEPVIFHNRGEWKGLSTGYTPDDMESLICLPIVRNQKIEAVLLIASVRKVAFEEFQLKILDILSSYFTVSVEKARYVQETIRKSNRCSLTKLYNYRYLEEQIEYEIDLVNSGHLEELSILILDIDHFKKINDTYGHQSGNDILVHLARLFEEMLPDGGVIGRYGGEEFVYILPSISKSEALVFAEHLRLKIESVPFRITPDLGSTRIPLDVYITISIGVSSAPEDTDEAKTILRNADRSLYLGAKQAGRNRVAGYAK